MLRLPDGRRLGFRVFGKQPFQSASAIEDTESISPDRFVIALHGTPGSRLKYAPADADARQRGLTLVALDRWGYGRSDVHPDPTLANWAGDVKAFADRLRIGRFAVCGISGGGPYAAALAAMLPDRVTAAALVAPVGPIAAVDGAREPDLDFLHAAIFRGLSRSPLLVEFIFSGFRRILDASPRTAIALAMARNGPADRRLLNDARVVGDLGRMMREGLRPGTRGPAIDLAIFRRGWRVPLSEIRAPARIWFGDQDRNVPGSAVETLARLVPNARLERLTNQGHFWVATRFDVVLDWLQDAEGVEGSSASAPQGDT